MSAVNKLLEIDCIKFEDKTSINDLLEKHPTFRNFIKKCLSTDASITILQSQIRDYDSLFNEELPAEFLTNEFIQYNCSSEQQKNKLFNIYLHQFYKKNFFQKIQDIFKTVAASETNWLLFLFPITQERNALTILLLSNFGKFFGLIRSINSYFVDNAAHRNLNLKRKRSILNFIMFFINHTLLVPILILKLTFDFIQVMLAITVASLAGIACSIYKAGSDTDTLKSSTLSQVAKVSLKIMAATLLFSLFTIIDVFIISSIFVFNPPITSAFAWLIYVAPVLSRFFISTRNAYNNYIPPNKASFQSKDVYLEELLKLSNNVISKEYLPPQDLLQLASKCTVAKSSLETSIKERNFLTAYKALHTLHGHITTMSEQSQNNILVKLIKDSISSISPLGSDNIDKGVKQQNLNDEQIKFIKIIIDIFSKIEATFPHEQRQQPMVEFATRALRFTKPRKVEEKDSQLQQSTPMESQANSGYTLITNNPVNTRSNSRKLLNNIG